MVAISGPQLRAARGMLDWTREQLAKEAGISQETIKNIEHGIFRPQESTTSSIIQAFAVHDVVFTENDGVQVRKDSVVRFEGVEGFKKFMDDVYEEACKPDAMVGGDKQIYVSDVDERLFMKYLGDGVVPHVKRMNALKNVKVKVLVNQKDYVKVTQDGYLEYRCGTLSNQSVPFYVYGDKFALIVFDCKNPPQVIVINSSLVAKAYREQFSLLWKLAGEQQSKFR